MNLEPNTRLFAGMASFWTGAKVQFLTKPMSSALREVAKMIALFNFLSDSILLATELALWFWLRALLVVQV